MKSGKDEGKQMEPPLFPRIRLTSAEKGGPRAPPRNKMAFSQQLSLSLPKFTPPSASSSSSSVLVPSTSSSPDSSSYRRSIFSSYHTTPGSLYLSARRIDSHNSGGIHLNTSRTTIRPTIRPEPEITDHQILCHKGSDSLRFTTPSVTSSRITCIKNLVDEDDYTVPTFPEPKMELEKLASSSSTRKRSAFTMEGLSLSKSSHEERNQKFTRTDQDCGIKLAGTEKKKGDLEKSTSKEISPDDVVELIGHKRFWKARQTLEQSKFGQSFWDGGRKLAHLLSSALVFSQQREFASQVFELHRLIMVQKLLAASPELLIEENLYSNKLKTTEPIKSFVTKPRNDHIPRKPAAKKISSASSVDKSICSKPIPLIYPPLSTIPTDPSTWCINAPPGNQWLVPVRSPSEGLVYKPYTGPYPPSGGLLAPIIGPPISLTHHTFNVPDSSGLGPMGPTYISPYIVPMIKPPSSSHISSVHQAIPLVKAPSSTVAFKTSSRKGGCCGPVLMGSSSGCSSSTERAHVGDELPLFPTEPTPEEGVKVIKVVPHNPKSASESAARIFRSIQEERNQGNGCRID